MNLCCSVYTVRYYLMRSIRALVGFFLCLQVVQVQAQIANSPYSVFGLGKLSLQGNLRTKAMGGAGVASPGYLYSNVQNPALLHFNRYTLYEAAFNVEHKSFETGEEATGANIDYLAFSFPVHKKVTLGLGVRPFSQVNYSISTSEILTGTQDFVSYNYSGSGGLSNAYLAAGWSVYKGLYLGAELRYNFGAVEAESVSSLNGGFTPFNVNVLERNSFYKLQFKFGTFYQHKLKNNYRLNVGLTYRPQVDLNVNVLREVQHIQAGFAVRQDTLNFEEKQTAVLPGELALGLGFEQANKWAINAEYAAQPWSNFVYTDGSQNMNNIQKFSFGGEFTPNYASIGSYFERITFRAGAYTQQQPWDIDGVQATERALTFGFSLPMNRGFSNINLTGIAGKLDAENLNTETFYRLHLGLSINDQWFVRRRFN